MAMFEETMSFLDASEDVAKNELVQEFRLKCKEIQTRVQDLIQNMQEEEFLGMLLPSAVVMSFWWGLRFGCSS